MLCPGIFVNHFVSLTIKSDLQGGCCGFNIGQCVYEFLALSSSDRHKKQLEIIPFLLAYFCILLDS
jgi:hypothetical protein